MKIQKEELVALFVALGFEKAGEWDKEKMDKMTEQLPQKAKDDDVPESHRELFSQIANSSPDEKLEILGYEAPKKSSKIDRAVDKAAKNEKEKENTVNKAKNGNGNKKPAAAADKKPAKAAKPVKAKKPAKEKTPEVPRDEFGSREGSIRAKVNATFSKDWRTFEDIVKDAGIKERQVRSRLRRACRAGIIEVRKIVEYRLKPKK